MSYILTADGLGKNSMQYEVGRGGYFPSSSATTETQAMLIKGACEAYRATGISGYLDKARLYADALITYFCFDTEAPGSGTWPCQWIVNGGEAFELQGPVSSVSPVYSGNIGTSVTFTSGNATISGLSRVYIAGSSDAVFNWNNVFSEIVEGTEYTILYFRDKNGAKFDADNNYLNDTDIAKAGEVQLGGAQATFSGIVKLNYSVYIATTIPFGDNFECWPMWRVLEAGEWKCAGDSIHWMYDAFTALHELDVTQTARWSASKAACLRNWETVIHLDDSAYVSKKEVDKLFDSWPLTFFKATVAGELITAPTAYLESSRDASGYVKFVLPADATRTNFNWNNESVFITGVWAVAGDALRLAIGTTADTAGEVILRDTNDNAFHCRWTWAAGSVPTSLVSIPLSYFNPSYSWGTAASPCWDEGSGIQYHVSIPLTSDGVGFGGNWATVPSITYNLTAGTMQMRSTDSTGAQAYTAMSSGLHTVTPTVPSGGHNIVNIDFMCVSAGTNTAVINTPTGVVNNTSPLHIRKVEVNLNSTAANTILIGDIQFTGAAVRETITYNDGALPFQLSSDNPATGGTMATAANFQGPYYIGYQNPCPYIGLNDYAKAEVMMNLIVASQAAYFTSTGITGPFAPVYIPNTWDGVMFAPASTFTWVGPDPNTFWGGFQYRPFAAVADFWQRCVTLGVSNGAVTKAATVTNSFLTWLDTWLTENPGETCIPTTFNVATDPVNGYDEPAMIAVALKGALFAKRAGADTAKATRVIQALYTLMVSFNITHGDMLGSFTPDPENGIFYGYWAGEMMESLALYIQIM